MSSASDLYQFQLENGLQVILQESHSAPVASFWLFYRVGSRNELPGQTGISHWVEHMMFKGTERFPRGEFDKVVARAGGQFNGMTGLDWTTYFETFPASQIELALQVESDRMVNSIFEVEEAEAERTVILSEQEGYENDYGWLLSQEVQAAAFQSHSYRHPIIGWKNDLLRIDRDDLYSYYRTYYTPNNAVAVVVGDFDSQAMTELLHTYFGPLPAGPLPTPLRVTEPTQRSERRVYLRGPDATAYLEMAFHVPDANHPDYFPLTVLDAVLAGASSIFGDAGPSRSSRLYRALVDTGLAVHASSGTMQTIDPYLFNFSAVLAEGVAHAQVEEAIWAEMHRIQADAVTPTELAKAIRQTQAQFVYGSESVTRRGYWLGSSALVADVAWFVTWLDRLAAVTAADVQRVAQGYFDPVLQTVGWYQPRGD